ncbi:AraC family transcriptional regulator [Paenibacillus thailandensis]|uniref:AraC family transcriptional regulator n=1 Tax=Paenibacillus thailandensis TaxID=393250 RepID=A0ABW5R4B0_9BACL
MPAYPQDPEYKETPYGTMLAGHFDQDDGYGHSRPKGMGDWLITYTIEGAGYFRTPAGERRCGAGQVALLRSGVPHVYGTVSGERWNFYWAHFAALPETGCLPDEEVLVQTMPEGFHRERTVQAFQSILHYSRERSAHWYALCENAVRELVLLLAQRLDKKRDPRVDQALKWLALRMKEEVRVEELAKEIGLSASRLSHLFKEETGEGVIEHLNGMRLRQAALYMEHMGRTATEASQDVGFNHYNHFADLFRKRYGVSPRAYAKQAKGRRDGN